MSEDPPYPLPVGRYIWEPQVPFEGEPFMWDRQTNTIGKSPRWGEAGADPIRDIEGMMKSVATFGRLNRYALLMSEKFLMWVKRRHMTKRGFRRWRARYRRGRRS